MRAEPASKGVRLSLHREPNIRATGVRPVKRLEVNLGSLDENRAPFGNENSVIEFVARPLRTWMNKLCVIDFRV